MESAEYFYAHSASLIQLLLSPNNREFPDAIYVNNDNCLPYVMDVFQKMSGHKEIRRIKIFSVGNAPYLPQFSHEIHYFAYDHLSALRKGLEFIDSWRRGKIRSIQKIPLRIEIQSTTEREYEKEKFHIVRISYRYYNYLYPCFNSPAGSVKGEKKRVWRPVQKQQEESDYRLHCLPGRPRRHISVQKDIR